MQLFPQKSDYPRHLIRCSIIHNLYSSGYHAGRSRPAATGIPNYIQTTLRLICFQNDTSILYGFTLKIDKQRHKAASVLRQNATCIFSKSHFHGIKTRSSASEKAVHMNTVNDKRQSKTWHFTA